MYEDRNYLILPVSELSKVDFEQVCETSAETVRKSVGQNKTFIKWDGNIQPTFVPGLLNTEGPYTHDEMLEILNTEEWAGNGTLPLA